MTAPSPEADAARVLRWLTSDPRVRGSEGRLLVGLMAEAQRRRRPDAVRALKLAIRMWLSRDGAWGRGQ